MLVANVIASIAPHFLLVAQIGLGWERNAPSRPLSASPMLAAQPLGEDVPIYIARRPEMYACFVEFVFVSSSRGG